jgi:hypothetical protein
MTSIKAYRKFVGDKLAMAQTAGWEVSPDEVHPSLKPHQNDQVRWAVLGGRRAVFSAFGLGKTIVQLEIIRLTLLKSGGAHGLIILPLGVRQEFTRDARDLLGTTVTFIRTDAERKEPGIYITNYESVREGKIDPTKFDAVSLDEASCLRGFGGTKTFREFMRRFENTTIPRFVATATPSPNEFIELLAYAAFLGIMDVGQAKTRFFKRNATKAGDLTIHPHKVEEFWMWVSSWALMIQRPSDLGHSDEGYALPPIEVRWHEVSTDHSSQALTRNPQAMLFKDAALGVVEASREKRDSLDLRIAKMLELRQEWPDEHCIIWHDLEAERLAIEKALPHCKSVFGNQDLDEREDRIIGFSNGEFKELAAKPVIAGSGCNFQRHCHRAIFLGIGFKFNDFIQAIHRIQRFLQTETVVIDIIYSEAERRIRADLERKWNQHKELVENMTDIIKKFGLSSAAISEAMARQMGVSRREASGDNWKLVNNDCVEELATMADSSAQLIVTSIPFSTQYEYSPNYNDFGHTDDNGHFWAQMDFLIPELLRVLEPGRIAAIHVKDRITPGGINGFGFQTVHPFSDECVQHFTKAGFALLARKTIVTDVVRENNQTYRLGWSEQCKDGSRMGAGMPEYLLVFRKPPTDTSNGYADRPVLKDRRIYDDETGTWINPQGYSRARWQMDAHGFTRSSGDRPLMAEDLKGLASDVIFKLFREHSYGQVYSLDHDVKLAETLEELGGLPSTFMLLQPQSWHPDVWTDITRMRTMNMHQSSKGREMHLCPLQFDIVDRAIVQMSNPGDVVLDPFAGLGTVPYCAIKLGRKGIGVELNTSYWTDSLTYLKLAEAELKIPSLFDLEDVPA